jgi:WD40 repeat protein
MSTISLIKPDGSKCLLCQGESNLLEFSCSHSFCKFCFHKVVIYNRDAFIKQINRHSENITLYCPKCDKGSQKLSKNVVKTFLKHEEVDNTEKEEYCTTHPDQLYQMTCTTCRVKLCFTCFKSHLADHVEHFFTSIKNDISNICNEHYVSGKKYEYKCLTCNKNICRNCATESHCLHNVKCLITYEKEILEKMRKEFPWKEDNDIGDYFDKHFDGLILKLFEERENLFKKCEEMFQIIKNFQIDFDKKIGKVRFDIIEIKDLLKQAFCKYNSDLKNNKNPYYLYLNVKIEKENWLKIVIDSVIKKEFDQIYSDIDKLKQKLLDSDIITIESIRKYDYIKVLDEHSQYIVSLQPYDERKLASLSNDNTVRIWNCTNDYECIKKISLNFKHLCLLVLKDGKIALGAWNNTIDILDMNGSLTTLKGHNGSVYCLLLLKDGRLASGSADNTIKIWEANGYKCTGTLEGHTNWVRSLQLISDGAYLASGSNDFSIKLWDVGNNFNLIKSLQGHCGYVLALIVLDNGMFASASGDATIRVWDIKNGNTQCVRVIRGHTSTINTLAIYKENMLVSASADGTIRLWDMRDNFNYVRILRGSNCSINNIAILKGGKVALGVDNKIKILNKLV